jgi:hypothetical protein
MKALFWFSLIFCVLCILVVTTGINRFQYDLSGWNFGRASAIERILAGGLAALSGAFAYGLREKKRFAWWMGTFICGLLTLGFLGNITTVTGEKDPMVIAWIVISQVLSACVPILIFLKWW